MIAVRGVHRSVSLRADDDFRRSGIVAPPGRVSNFLFGVSVSVSSSPAQPDVFDVSKQCSAESRRFRGPDSCNRRVSHCEKIQFDCHV